MHEANECSGDFTNPVASTIQAEVPLDIVFSRFNVLTRGEINVDKDSEPVVEGSDQSVRRGRGRPKKVRRGRKKKDVIVEATELSPVLEESLEDLASLFSEEGDKTNCVFK